MQTKSRAQIDGGLPAYGLPSRSDNAWQILETQSGFNENGGFVHLPHRV